MSCCFGCLCDDPEGGNSMTVSYPDQGNTVTSAPVGGGFTTSLPDGGAGMTSYADGGTGMTTSYADGGYTNTSIIHSESNLKPELTEGTTITSNSFNSTSALVHKSITTSFKNSSNGMESLIISENIDDRSNMVEKKNTDMFFESTDILPSSKTASSQNFGNNTLFTDRIEIVSENTREGMKSIMSSSNLSSLDKGNENLAYSEDKRVFWKRKSLMTSFDIDGYDRSNVGMIIC